MIPFTFWDVFNGFEFSVLIPIIDDGLRVGWTNARQCLQLFCRGMVDVNRLSRRQFASRVAGGIKCWGRLDRFWPPVLLAVDGGGLLRMQRTPPCCRGLGGLFCRCDSRTECHIVLNRLEL